MSNCKLQTLYFAATRFEVLDEFEGEKGTFIRSFLISDKLNLNDWEVTAEANRLDGPDFVGKPGIEFFREGRRDHTVGNTYNEALNLQEPFAKARIRKVLGTETGEKLEQISRIFDDEIIQKIRTKEIEFVSPAIFPQSVEDVEIIVKPDGGHIHRVHRYRALHYAFVNEPAFGPEARIGEICDGPDCVMKLSAAKKIPEIIRVAKCAKTGNTTVQISGASELSKKVSECLSNKLAPGEEPTDQDIAICYSEAREQMKKSLTSKISKTDTKDKTMAEENNDDKKLEARIAQLEEKEKKREEEAKKAKKAAEQNEDNNEEVMKENSAQENNDKDKEEKNEAQKYKKAKKGQEEETDKEKELSSKLAQLTKIANAPIIASYLKARRMIGDSEEKINETKTAMLKASVEENQARLDEIQPFIAHFEFNEKVESTPQTKFPYGLGGEQFSGSTNKTAEELYEEAYS